MKKKLIFLCLLLFIAYILTAPKDAVNAASVGLVLWYTRVLPTLLPFVILSNILMDSNYLQYLNKITAPLVSRLIPVSDNGAFVLLSGFLFGFPIGSKNCAALLASGKITRREADVLFIITNNISPVFVTSFILYTQLKLSHLSAVTLLILYFPALLLGSILLSTDARRTKDRTAFHAQKQPASGSQMNFKIIDTGIMDGFETLTRLGGYIMLFSMIASLLQKLPVPRVVTLILTGMVEITNGIAMLPDSGLPKSTQYVLVVVYTAFGGLSGIAQTSSMIRDTPLSIKRYCIAKLVLAACCGLLACLVSQIFHL